MRANVGVAGLTEQEAIEAARREYTLAPTNGARWTSGGPEAFRGWLVSFTDRRSRRPARKTFVIYDETVTRDAVMAAIEAWFTQAGR